MKEMTFKRCKQEKEDDWDCVVLSDDLDSVIMMKSDYPEFEKFIEEETDWKGEQSPAPDYSHDPEEIYFYK